MKRAPYARQQTESIMISTVQHYELPPIGAMLKQILIYSELQEWEPKYWEVQSVEETISGMSNKCSVSLLTLMTQLLSNFCSSRCRDIRTMPIRISDDELIRYRLPVVLSRLHPLEIQRRLSSWGNKVDD
jgi:hypothetical protein